MTNDTNFADHVMSPEHKVPKTYLVKTTTLITEEQINQLRRGITLSDGPTKPATVSRLADTNSKSTLEITITEGRNRQVRRMIEAIGSKVRKLVRTAIGPVRIEKLEIGRFRKLTKQEISLLFAPRVYNKAK
jgi:23S rRNA pseudouridine2605 synthase